MSKKIEFDMGVALSAEGDKFVPLPENCEANVWTTYHVTLTPVEPELQPEPVVFEWAGQEFSMLVADVAIQIDSLGSGDYTLTLKGKKIETEPELLPCPFCGAQAQIGHHPDAGPDSKWSVVCCRRLDCQAEIVDATEAGAIAAWNRRV